MHVLMDREQLLAKLLNILSVMDLMDETDESQYVYTLIDNLRDEILHYKI